jgi:putative membrane protein
MMHDLVMHGGWPWLALWILFKVALWALIATAVIFAIRRLRGGACIGRLTTPLEILKARYARGELSREQFETMKRELEAP